jgi:hypothetical protein
LQPIAQTKTKRQDFSWLLPVFEPCKQPDSEWAGVQHDHIRRWEHVNRNLKTKEKEAKCKDYGLIMAVEDINIPDVEIQGVDEVQRKKIGLENELVTHEVEIDDKIQK